MGEPEDLVALLDEMLEALKGLRKAYEHTPDKASGKIHGWKFAAYRRAREVEAKAEAALAV